MISSSIHAEIPQKLPEEFENGVPFFPGYFIVAVFLPAGVHLRVREPGVRVYVERRERVGNRRGGDIWGFGVCCLGGSRRRCGFIGGRSHSEHPFLAFAKVAPVCWAARPSLSGSTSATPVNDTPISMAAIEPSQPTF